MHFLSWFTLESLGDRESKSKAHFHLNRDSLGDSPFGVFEKVISTSGKGKKSSVLPRDPPTL